ncbi:2-hydroxyacyl-CoA dehydratase [bacterium]|nr:2-hydroxyacyl-CoA dehydratase [bacterium]
MGSRTQSNKKVWFTCTYVPLEIIWAAGYTPQRVIGNEELCLHPDSLLSRNLCPYVHSVMRTWNENHKEEESSEKRDHLVITNSCDAMKSLYNTLKLKYPPIHLLTVPHHNRKEAVNFFAQQLENLYSSLKGKREKNPYPDLRSAISLYQRIYHLLEKIRNQVGETIDYVRFYELKQEVFQSPPQQALARLSSFWEKHPQGEDGSISSDSKFPVALTGSPIPGKNILSLIQDCGFHISLNDSCLDYRWGPFGEKMSAYKNPFLALSQIYLNKIPCARMATRKEEIEKQAQMMDKSFKAIIHMRMPFCDLYGLDLVDWLKRIRKEKILPLETDGSQQSLAQVKTRVQAFAEALSQKKQKGKTATRTIDRIQKYYCGIDIGSSTVEGVILSSSGKILVHGIEKTGPYAGKTALQVYKNILRDAGLNEKDLSLVVSTGYGRETPPFPHQSITEITCHAYGIRHLFAQVRFVIDIGGQDSKVIKMDKKGKVTDFQMNDKCAAGTGKFLEVMARTLEMDIQEMSRVDPREGKSVPLSSMCTVFAESEVVSLIGQGYPVPEIIRGLYQAITNRMEGMVRRLGLSEPLAVTGGGALNQALVSSIENRLGISAHVPEYPQIVGAIGASILARERHQS